MGKLKRVGDNFYFLAETQEERDIVKLKWDGEKRAYYTDDFIKAEKLKQFATEDSNTKSSLELMESNREGSYGETPLKGFCKSEGVFDYQARGVQELLTRILDYRCALLADEQGLGKTIQIVKLMEHFTNPILVICPASLKLNWEKEILEWHEAHSSLDIQVVTTSKDWLDANAQIVIVNYDLLTKEHIQSQLSQIRFGLCVCDEAHYLKNAKAARTKAAAKIMKVIPNNIALTGTPVLNKPIELYAILKCLKATTILKPYDNLRAYAYRYCSAFNGRWGFETGGASNPAELNARLRSTIMIRREKSQVLSQLPDKSYQIIPLEADKACREICANLSKLDIKLLEEKPELGSVGEIAKLRHDLAMAKIDDCITHIKCLLENKNKLVVFAHHRAVITKLQESLRDYGCVVFDGSTSASDKNKAVESFQKDEACRVFIGQMQSAGVGITLTAADTVVFVESSWVPGEVEQAVDRCHRIGQKNHVTAQFLTVSGSIDEIMLLAIAKKKKVINKIMK
jgi:SWI/SNF-related matrix-associated actin-dependent regulator 1 of chromatin subfamily A